MFLFSITNVTKHLLSNTMFFVAGHFAFAPRASMGFQEMYRCDASSPGRHLIENTEIKNLKPMGIFTHKNQKIKIKEEKTWRLLAKLQVLRKVLLNPQLWALL